MYIIKAILILDNDGNRLVAKVSCMCVCMYVMCMYVKTHTLGDVYRYFSFFQLTIAKIYQ